MPLSTTNQHWFVSSCISCFAQICKMEVFRIYLSVSILNWYRVGALGGMKKVNLPFIWSVCSLLHCQLLLYIMLGPFCRCHNHFLKSIKWRPSGKLSDKKPHCRKNVAWTSTSLHTLVHTEMCHPYVRKLKGTYRDGWHISVCTRVCKDFDVHLVHFFYNGAFYLTVFLKAATL